MGAKKRKAESLSYTMLGEDTAPLAEKLAKYTGVVRWSYLRPHYLSEVLYFVDRCLDLVEVGAVFAEEGAAAQGKVADWLAAGDLVKIGALHAHQWDQMEGRGEAVSLEALVVSPFVLCKDLR